jgi:response regulator of citrate/malate metabolism
MDKIDSILLVDDDNITNFINARLLNKLNIANRVQISINGQEALNYINEIENKCPDLILLDINMPVMNGFEFLQSYCERHYCSNLPVIIILTTSSDHKDIEQLEKYPVVCGFMNKPLTEEKISSILKEHFVR